MRYYSLISAVFCIALILPRAAGADVRLYTGTLEVVTTSGKACDGRKGNYQISLVIGSEDDNNAVSGYVGGDTVTVGQLRGQSLGELNLRYPYPDADHAEGHSMRIEISGTSLHGELRDRHLDAASDGCNFDLARIKMLLVAGDAAANEAYQRLSRLYEAQLVRSTAVAITRTGDYAGAVHVFEKALALADELYPPDSAPLIPYLTGQIRSLLRVGRSALEREEYQAALDKFRQALRIDYKNKEAIEATMSALDRSGQHEEAIAFLEETEHKLEVEPYSQDVREALALVLYQKAVNEQKTGRTVEAERVLHRAIKLDPGTTLYLVALARWVHKAGKYHDADAILKRGLESFKDEARRRELIEAREKLRQTEKILAKIRRAGS